MSSSYFKNHWALYAAGAALVGFVVLLVAYISTPRTSDVLPAVTATLVPETIATVTLAPSGLATDTPAIDSGTAIETRTQTIVLRLDSWGMEGKVTKHYILHREGDRFRGTATFAGLGYGDIATAIVNTEIIVPADAAKSFLHLLAGVVAHPQTEIPPSFLTPYATLSDCYIDDSIELQTIDGVVSYSTHSCATLTTHVPWQVQTKMQSFNTYSTAPSDALEIFTPYLHFDIAKTLYIALP